MWCKWRARKSPPRGGRGGLLDRTLGKADQRLEVTGEGGGPVETEITLRLQFADRHLITERPLLEESPNGEI